MGNIEILERNVLINYQTPSAIINIVLCTIWIGYIIYILYRTRIFELSIVTVIQLVFPTIIFLIILGFFPIEKNITYEIRVSEGVTVSEIEKKYDIVKAKEDNVFIVRDPNEKTSNPDDQNSKNPEIYINKLSEEETNAKIKEFKNTIGNIEILTTHVNYQYSLLSIIISSILIILCIAWSIFILTITGGDGRVLGLIILLLIPVIITLGINFVLLPIEQINKYEIRVSDDINKDKIEERYDITEIKEQNVFVIIDPSEKIIRDTALEIFLRNRNSAEYQSKNVWTKYRKANITPQDADDPEIDKNKLLEERSE